MQLLTCIANYILRLHRPQIPSGCLPIFGDDPRMEKYPYSFGGAFCVISNEIVLSRSQSPIAFRPSPSLVRKSAVYVEVTGVLYDCSRSIVVTILFHTVFCIHFPESIVSHLSGAANFQFCFDCVCSSSLSSPHPSNSPFRHLFVPNCNHSSRRDSVTPLLVAFRMVLLHVTFFH